MQKGGGGGLMDIGRVVKEKGGGGDLYTYGGGGESDGGGATNRHMVAVDMVMEVLHEQLPSIVPRHTIVEAKSWPCLEKLATLQFPQLHFDINLVIGMNAKFPVL
ncbi:hypothetical protein OIU85_001363 [Salix viminalis]|uniref:Uncharacterized protein n=1 Tax=Salix viminalis TaxID=40686 RepID=A0A9Q0VNM4_SALVM|nr:hypothetical protein OIU85_001363 [Salix viminalis]